MSSSLVLLLLLPAQPGCPGGPCPPPHYEWREIPGTGQLALLRGGRQVGAWHVVGGYYRALRPGGEWGPRESRPPADPPRANFGLEEGRLSGKERYLFNGREVSRQQVAEMVGSGGTLPDLAGKYRLTVIGPPAAREPVLRDLAGHPRLAALKDRLIVAGYNPDHWHVARVGFVTAGNPTIYLQDPAGVVLHRQDDYQGGPEALAAAVHRAVERLRRPDPNYDPKKDPDARRPATPDLAEVPWSTWVMAGAGAVVLYLGRRKK